MIINIPENNYNRLGFRSKKNSDYTKLPKIRTTAADSPLPSILKDNCNIRISDSYNIVAVQIRSFFCRCRLQSRSYIIRKRQLFKALENVTATRYSIQIEII